MGVLAGLLVVLFVVVTCVANWVCRKIWVGLLVGPVAGTAFAFLSINLLYVVDGRREKFIAIALFFGTLYAFVASTIVSLVTYFVGLFRERRQAPLAGHCLYGNQSGGYPECGGVVLIQGLDV